jgi:cytochrome c oxidase assembly protein Cox11
MLDDAKMDDVSHITLSYTFFPVDDDDDENTL